MSGPGPRPEDRLCLHCGQRLEPISVHGHIQCAACGTNVEPCCQGAPQGDPEGVAANSPGWVNDEG